MPTFISSSSSVGYSFPFDNGTTTMSGNTLNNNNNNNFRDSRMTYHRVNDNRLIRLLDLLDRIQSASTISTMERCMHAFTKELLQIDNHNESNGTNNNNNNSINHHTTTSMRSSSIPTSTSGQRSANRRGRSSGNLDDDADKEEEVTLFMKGDETMLQDLEARGVLVILLRTMTNCLGYEQTCRYNQDHDSSINGGGGVDNRTELGGTGGHNNGYHHTSQGFLRNVLGTNQSSASHRPPAYYCCVSPQFFNSACIALVHLCFQSDDRSKWVFDHGGLDLVIEIMKTYRFVDYVQIIGMAAMMVLGQIPIVFDRPWLSSFSSPTTMSTMPDDYYRHVNMSTYVGEQVLSQIVLALECHPNNKKLYTVACSALSTLLGCSRRSVDSNSHGLIDHGCHFRIESEHVVGSVGNHPRVFWMNNSSYYQRALTAIGYGAIVHLSDDPMTLSTGQTLLFNLIGQSSAERMIMELEQSYFGLSVAAAA